MSTPELALVFQALGIVAIPNLGPEMCSGGPLGPVSGPKLSIYVENPSRTSHAEMRMWGHGWVR